MLWDNGAQNALGFFQDRGEFMPKTAKLLSSVSFIAVVAALSAVPASAHAPLPSHRGYYGSHLPPYHAPKGSGSGTWQALKNGFPGTSFPDTSLLMTDGSVLMHDGCTPDWYRLTPDENGSYTNGTWKQAGSMDSGYGPLYFAAQVLADGRLIINGGEYNFCTPTEGSLGALYDPVKDKWTVVNPPKNWNSIGDSQSVVLADGTYMLANCCAGLLDANPPQAAIAAIKGTKVKWKPTGSGKADFYDEEGWHILADKTVLTIDAWLDQDKDFSDTEIYDPATGAWTPGTHTTAIIEDPGSKEVGPGILMNSGNLLQVGANACPNVNCASHSSIYDPVSGTWSKGPDLPKVGGVFYNSEDGPAAQLPGGNVLVQLSPGNTCGTPFCAPSHFFEFDGKHFKQVDDTAEGPSDASYEGRMLMLPSGQVFWSGDNGDIEVYTAKGTPKDSWRPTVTSSPKSAKRGDANLVVQGTLFNGLSTGASYGDDVQQSTNYPLVRITNAASGHVCYARTHDHSSMGISDGGPTSTKFDLPSACDAGKSKLEVVANGIASKAVSIKIE
jgi:hypothetical protein